MGRYFDRKLTDIFSVESEVARTIADQLRAKSPVRKSKSSLPNRRTILRLTTPTCVVWPTLKTVPIPANPLGAQKYLREAVQLDPKFALSWALFSNVESRAYRTQSLQPTVALREEARQQPKPRLLFSPTRRGRAGQGILLLRLPKGYDTRCVTLSKRVNSCRIAAGFLNRWLTSSGRGEWERSESYFNEAERLDPRNVYINHPARG